MSQATTEAIEELFRTHQQVFPDPDAASRDGRWASLREMQESLLPYVVRYPSDPDTDNARGMQLEVFRWLRDNIGAECLAGCYAVEEREPIQWQRGCWDWYWSENTDNQLEFLFLDPTDATLFKLRWC